MAIVTLVDRKLKPLQTTLNDTSKTVTEMHVSLFGVDGRNGLRSDIRKLQSDVECIRDDLRQVQFRVSEWENAE